MPSEEVQEKFMDLHKEYFFWISHACYYSYFDFVIFSKKNEYDFLALTKPLDIYSWGFLVSSVVLVAIFMISSLTINESNRSIDFQISLLWTFGILLDISEGTISLKLNKKPRLILCFWLLAAIVISNGYKGAIFSFMSKITYPTVPKSLEDLSNTNITMLTAAHDFSHIASNIEKYQPNLARSVSKLNNRTRQLSLYWNFQKNIKKVIKDIGLQPLGVIDRERWMQLWVGRMSFKSDYFVLKSKDITMRQILLRHPWDAVRNFFVTIFVPYLRSYHESGILEWDSNNYDVNLLTRTFKYIMGNNNINYFAFFALCGGKSKDEVARPQPMILKKLYMVLIISSILIALAIMIFCWEKLCRCNKTVVRSVAFLE